MGETQKELTLEIIYAAIADNQVFFLTVALTDDDGTRNIIANQQRIRDDVSEIITLTGTGEGTVTIIVDGNAVVRRNVNFNTGELH